MRAKVNERVGFPSGPAAVDADHTLMIERSDKINEAIAAWLVNKKATFRIGK